MDPASRPRDLGERYPADAVAAVIEHPLVGLEFRYPFRKYQRLVLDQVEAGQGDNRYHIVAPPGAGKTILGLELVRRFGAPAVVFAPTTTIQDQWQQKLAMFLPGDGDVQEVSSLDSDRLAPINVFTYQLISTPGEAAELLRDLAHKRWIEELLTAGQVADEQAAEARLSTLKANNPAAYARDLATRALHAKRQLLREENRDVTAFLHNNAKALIDHLIAHGVRTVVLDECHHLLDYWALVIRQLISRIENPYVVGLTATLPDPEDEFAFDNYHALLGDVDFEVPTPAVVKEGELAPYMELVQFVHPTEREDSFLQKVELEFATALAGVTGESRFAHWVRLSTLGSTEAEAPTHWESLLQRDAPLAMAGMGYLIRTGVQPPAGVIVPNDLMTDADHQAGVNEWLTLLERYGLDVLKMSPDRADHERLAVLRTSLHPFGFTLTEEGLRQSRSIGDLVLSFSQSKDLAVARILRAEAAAQGDDIRAVVVTDFEHDRQGVVEAGEALDHDAGSARRVYGHIGADADLASLNPILVTGEVLEVLADRSDDSLAVFNRWLAEQRFKASCQPRPTKNVNVVEILGEGRDWSPRTYVEMVTGAFEAGFTKCLIGTRGLLGEGWDAVSLNTLVDLTTVTTSAAVQQLRGRSLRLDPSRPRKVAHNWDVICVATDFEKGNGDLRRMLRRHERLWGLNPKGQVVRGVAHVSTKLAYMAIADFRKVDYVGISDAQMREVVNREAQYALWKIGDDYSNFSYQATRLEAPDLKIRTVYSVTDTLRRMLLQFWPAVVVGALGGAFAILKYNGNLAFRNFGLFLGVALIGALAGALLEGARRAYAIARKLLIDQPPDAIMRDVARAVVTALADAGLISVSLTVGHVRVVADEGGGYQVYLDGASSDDAAVFTDAYRQVFAPVLHQRYLIERDDWRLPNVALMAFWVWLRPMVQRAAHYPPALYPVPDVLGSHKERAEAYAKAWSRYVGGGKLVYTKSHGGFEVVLRAQAQRRPKVGTVAFEFWR